MLMVQQLCQRKKNSVITSADQQRQKARAIGQRIQGHWMQSDSKADELYLLAR